jgi:hypothetical protein
MSILLLLLLQLSLQFPPGQTINVSDDPIDENVEFTVEPLLGMTDEKGRVKVTFHCQAVVRDGYSPDVDWFLIVDGHMEVAALEDADPHQPCGDTWHLEPGTYEIRTRKTDNIRFDQSIEFHLLEPMDWELRGVCLFLGPLFTVALGTLKKRFLL